MVYSFGIMGEESVPPSDVIGQNIIERRNHYTNATYYFCCVQYTPPYNSTIDSIVDDTCKWPKWNSPVSDKCKANGQTYPYTCFAAMVLMPTVHTLEPCCKRRS